MCVSVTVLLATLVLLQGVAASRLPPDSCLHQCFKRKYPMETKTRLRSSSCCDLTTFKCVTDCKMQQKDVFPDPTSLDGTISGSVDYYDGASLEVAVSSAWRDALASCRSCRKKRKSRSPLVREAALIARSVGMDLMTGAEPLARPFKVQNVRVVSQSRAEDTVSVVVSWEPASSTASGLLYLVSWQVQGDALRGTLLTNIPFTTLSLLPDTVYDLQISTVGADFPSGCLVVDTHSPPPAHFTHNVSLTEESAVAAAALSALLVLALLLAMRWRSTGALGVKDNAQLRDCDHFKVFPPPVTLLVLQPPTHESSTHTHP